MIQVKNNLFTMDNESILSKVKKKHDMISPEKFLKTMIKYTELFSDNYKIGHFVVAALMCDVLIQLGYGDGVEVYDKWKDQHVHINK